MFMKTAVVLVLYHPDWNQIVRLVSDIQRSVHTILLMDNTESENIPEHYPPALSTLTDVRYIPFGANVGIAAAQNRAVDELRKIKTEFVLFLDQDSQPSPQMIDRLVEYSCDLARAGHRVAAIGPRIDRDPTETDRRALDSKLVYSQVETLIASGMLVKLDAIDAIGRFDDLLFIDHVETDWLFRAKKQGYQVFQAHHIWMKHALGEHTLSVQLHRRFQIALHRPDRYFYQIRNLIWLLRRRTISLPWGLGRLSKTVMIALLCVITQTDKPAYLQSIKKGLHAGFVKGI